jgi:hypothetical protein
MTFPPRALSTKKAYGSGSFKAFGPDGVLDLFDGEGVVVGELGLRLARPEATGDHVGADVGASNHRAPEAAAWVNNNDTGLFDAPRRESTHEGVEARGASGVVARA